MFYIIKNSDGTPSRVVTDEQDELEAGQTRVTGTDAEVAAAQSVIATANAKTVRDAARQARYQAESDPLFFKAQRGEATLDDWKAKVAEIQADIP